MNYRDTLVNCQECGKQFVFTVETQRQMAESGLEVIVPEYCSACTGRIKYGGKLHGRVKWFSTEKGYGFITEDSGKEIFVHRNSIVATEDGSLPLLSEGQQVLYEVTDTPKGPQAVRVTAYAKEAERPT
jgi:CspA family cold shock protein